jgi:hypothetical protein
MVNEENSILEASPLVDGIGNWRWVGFTGPLLGVLRAGSGYEFVLIFDIEKVGLLSCSSDF